jgi:hypothetical protein
MYINEKLTPVETLPGIGVGEIKNDGGSDFNYDVL